MADPTTAEPPAPTESQAFLKQLVSSTEKVLPPEPIGDAPLQPTVTLGEAVSVTRSGKAVPWVAPQKTKSELDAEAKAAADKADADKAAAEKAEADKKEAERKSAEAAKPTPAPPMRKKVEPPPQVAPVAQTPPPKVEPDPVKIDETGLTPEEQEDLAIARFAESKGKKGIVEDTVRFFGDIKKFAEEHPDVDPDSEEFQKFLKDKKPKWNEVEKRKAERQMIAEEAAEAARKSLAPEIQQQKAKLRAMETKPFIDQMVSKVDDLVTAKPENPQLQPIDKTVVDAIREKGYEEAARQYPDEAPIINGAKRAAEAWMQASQGTRALDPLNNGIDSWLVTFIAQQGEHMRAQPREVQTLKDGRTFLPLSEYLALPQNDRAKHWSFDDEMIVDMISNEAVMRVNQVLNTRKAAGWTRETKKVSTTPETPPKKEETVTGGSPRAGATALPGASDTVQTAQSDEISDFKDKLLLRGKYAPKP